MEQGLVLGEGLPLEAERLRLFGAGRSPRAEASRPHGGSVVARVAGFVSRHPGRAAQFALFVLIAIVILQNVESTSIDVLFWSVPALPKLVLIFVSMLVGAATWDLMRRWIRG